MDAGHPCTVALDYLEHSEVRPVSECLPSAKPHGLTTGSLFLCPCPRCTKDGGPVDYRSDCFNKLRDQELREEYSLIYALLVYIRRPGLIQKFQKYELKLEGTKYLCDADFDSLRRERILDLELVQRKTLHHQYSFLVRTLRPASDIISIPARELLPIKEDAELKGEGTFAQVRCFEFQYDEYRSRDFGTHITRFARKIFKHGMHRSAAKEWYNLQRLSKEKDHPHLMPALGAYWHGSYFFILQEEAEQSLHDYLKDPSDTFEPQELWTQMQGIAEGLSMLHNLYKDTKIAYHQDLKPANILIVKRKLKIADFGLLELRPVALPGDTDMTGIPNNHVTGFYAAPPPPPPPRQSKYTRDCDIWSLGCIMSEVAACDIQGPQGVNDYRNARMADGPSGRDIPRFFRGQKVKDAVVRMHAQLYDHVQSTIPTNGDLKIQFQRNFYTKEFFGVLDRMFKRDRTSADLLDMPGEEITLDAAQIAETLKRLRKEGLPPILLDNGVGQLGFDEHLQDAERLQSLMEACLTGFTDILNRRNGKRFPATTVNILKQYVVNLQHMQHAAGRQQGLARLGPFLERFGEFAELVATLPRVQEIMGFIWSTNTYPDAFNSILDIYGQIGRAQPFSSMYKELFQVEPSLTKILIAAYSDIIQVNRWLIIYFQQRLWTELFPTTWKRQKSRLTTIISRMMSRRKLVNDRAGLDQFDSFEINSVHEEEALNDAADRENLARKHAVYAWIKPTDMENEQEYLKRIRIAYPGTCMWLLDDLAFQEWFDQHSDTVAIPKLLWLNGKPGSGKTVLASLVVEEARKLEPSPTVLFFYFKQEDSDRNNFLSMARTLLSQILERNPHILDYFYSKCCSSGRAVLTSRSGVEELLKFALGNCESAYIVLDGLDECCSRKERGEIVSWFRDLIENGRPEVREAIHCDYRDLPSITADTGNNEEDIEAFCKAQAERLVPKFEIKEDYAHEIAQRVSAAAAGVFLFAHLVWINLYGQSSQENLDREMETFETDLNNLDKLYARIMRTVLDKPVTSQRDEALLLLGWLVCAKRSLKMQEVQTLWSVDFDERAVKFERRQSRVHPKDLCESLVEVHEDGTIELVHMTARTYLAKSDFLDVTTGELQMAMLCIDYLNLPSLQDPSEENVLAGEYGFLEYSTLYWLRHLEVAMSSAPPDQVNVYHHLIESLEVMVEQYWNKPAVNVSSVSRSASKRTRDVLQHFRHRNSFPDIQLALVLTDKQLKHFGDMRPEENALKIADVVSAVCRCIETCVTHSSNPNMARLRDMYGRDLFRCPRFSCIYFTDGFSTVEERDKHAQLTRHLKENHPDMTERHHIFPTDEEISESMREVSPEPEAAIEDEPQLFSQLQHPLTVLDPAGTPTSEEAEPQSAQPMTVSKRQRTKREHVCPHCDKIFTKKYNLDSHLATHGNSQRLECPHCDTTCARLGDFRRHLKLHNVNSAVTCGGVLPDGRKWGCGTNFARLDILRSHHKSRRGRQCVAQRDSEEQPMASTS
ncbi:hypothetical protein PSV08DRAFT_408868 [Bipolaris maydis]|uniref:uncharacterized protein n=1 Tax=Cochliobolus heterostrophus TaxID=5016 RepID=UPI0024DB82C9|nr:hypothetical protein PSV08DRAFT_408868 [Bipolaris maydis]